MGGEKLSLIPSNKYPHRPAKSASLARYLKDFLGKAGIDLTVFTAHSTIAASPFKANNLGMSLKNILKVGHWRSPSTVQQFYRFPICKKMIDDKCHGMRDASKLQTDHDNL